jgi:hypothetical protein
MQYRRPRQILGSAHVGVNVQQIFRSGWMARHAMLFAVPMVWREPSNHATDCYFCMVPPVSGGITKKNKLTFLYPNILSALRPVPRAKEFPFPNLRKNLPSIQTTRTKVSRPRVLPSRQRLLNHTFPTVGLLRHNHAVSHSTNWKILIAIWSCPRAKQSYWNQDLNNRIFLRKMSEFLCFWSRHQQLVPFFIKVDDLVFCYDVDGLMNALGIKHDQHEWRLFMDSLKLSLKAALLHNGNRHTFIPVGHAVHKKETHGT